MTHIIFSYVYFIKMAILRFKKLTIIAFICDSAYSIKLEKEKEKKKTHYLL